MNTAFEIQVISTLAIKCWSDFKIFQFASAVRRQEKLLKTQQTPLYIMMKMATPYFGIFPKAMIWFFTSWDQ